MTITVNLNMIRHAEAEKLRNEVEAFLASGVKTKSCEVIATEKALSKKYHSSHYVKMRQLKAEQKAVLQEYSARTTSRLKWRELSDAMGGKVSSKMLAFVNRGDTAIKKPELWLEVVRAIEELSK